MDHDTPGNGLEMQNDTGSGLELQISKLQSEKTQLETDFGLKRAKFKELFIQKEDELKKEQEKRTAAEAKASSMEAELKTMKEEMDKVQWELEGVKTAAAVSEGNRQEEVNNLTAKYHQEIASLQQLLQEASETASENTAARYESERSKLVTLNENYEEEIQELRNKLSQEKEGFLSTVAKSIKRVGTVGSANTSLEHENLEESMRKAQEDANLLKSVVVPLETEIKSLKEKLEHAQSKLKAAESKQPDKPSATTEIINDGPVGRASPSIADVDASDDVEEKVDKLYSYLKAEKAARTDLEMYVAVLSTQKSVLQDESDKIKDELEDVCRLLDEEKQSHESLKQTWQMANDQFLESQRLLMMDLRRMEGVLSAEQQRQIAELQQKDESREAQEKKVKDLEEKREKQEREAEERRKISQSRMEKERTRSVGKSSEASPVKSVSELDGKMCGEATPTTSSVRRSASSTDVSGTHEDFDEEEAIFLDSGVHETRSLSEADGMLGRDLSEGIQVRISPEKVLNLPSLSAAQMKAITDPTPETEAHKSLVANIRSKPRRNVSLEGKRLVSEREWTLLQDEMRASREKLGRPCSMCSNYEAQLQSVQEELKTAHNDLKKAERALEAEKKSNQNLSKYQTELEEALKNASEDAQSQITQLTNKIVESENSIKEFKELMSSTHLQLQDHCKSLSENRTQVQKELSQLQEENDSLVDKYSKTAQQLQNEDINLPNNLDEMQLLLLKYREEIISAKVAKEHTEETLRSEIVFLKSQVTGEQQERTTLEETLTQEISGLQSRIGEMENLKKDLEQESALRTSTETKLKENETSLKNIQAKSKALVNKMQEKLEDVDRKRSKFESENHTLRSKVQSLQVDLDNSEAVQRDFVKLSQSLQIQLEKIRQAETEVRWQHEEDVEECGNCKQPFTVTRRKHHCRHCGKIFCSECTSKSVNSGPNARAAKVCDVCHTILVKDATPYFSREPPATPD